MALSTLSAVTLTVAGMTLEELQDKVIRFERGDDPVPYAVGLITKLEPDGKGYVHFTAEGPAVLLLSRDLPFELPMNEQIRNRAGFAFWWKQLDYVFNLTDPRTFPPLEAAVGTDERRAIERYIQTAADLAETEVLNALDQGFSARKNDETGEEIVAAAFGRKDAQLGLSGLLRHCDSRAHKDGARFGRIHEILLTAAEQTQDVPQKTEQLRQLEAWRAALELLHSLSLDQCVRDRLVSEKGWKVFDYREHHRPDFLIRVYDYGDLLHWPTQTRELEILEADEFLAAFNRHSFFEAIAGLAHLYIGFAELAGAALGGEASA
jgi:hypothetical protein